MRSFHLMLLLLGGLLVMATGLSLLLTPAPVSSQVFITNTPLPTEPPLITPDAPLEQYALRLWIEQELIDVLADQLTRLIGGEREQQDAIRLTLYELERRFPGAPRRLEQRERLLELMLAAPRGSVDMRPIARPYIVEMLNQRRGEFTPGIETTLTINGFAVRITPLNLDGSEPLDALLHVRYPAQAEGEALLYESYSLVRGTDDGRYTLVSAAPDFPAAPLAGAQSVALVRQGDLNLDGLDEIALSVDTGAVNRELLIYGWRAEEVINLAQPGQRILFGELIDWPFNEAALTVAEYRQESIRWDCVGARPVRWEWSANFYRPSIGDNVTFTPLETIGCELLGGEPIFTQRLDDTIPGLTWMLENTDPYEAGYDRAGMTLAMLLLLNEQPRSAAEVIESLRPLAVGNDWLTGQIEAFEAALAGDTFAPVEICAALVARDENGACAVDQVLTRIFDENPIIREAPALPQIERLGLPILETTTISQAGRRDRLAVSFDLTGASWWTFAPTDETYYVAAPVDPPVAIAEVASPAALVELPPGAFTAMLNGQVSVALNAVDNAMRDNPGVPLSLPARYMKALGYDLLGDRQAAGRAYYELWAEQPATAWGRLAGAHLERR
jgi:hypothetical protein